MEINAQKEKDALVVSVKGRIDAVTAPAFEKRLMDLIGKGGEKGLIMNFGTVEYVSSAGLRAILSAAKQLKAKGGKMVFAGLQGPVKEVFRISGFGSIFPVCETREDAFAQL